MKKLSAQLKATVTPKSLTLASTKSAATAKPKIPEIVKVLDQSPLGLRRVELRQTGPQQYEVWKIEASTWGGEVAAMKLAAGAGLPVPRFLGQETIAHPSFGSPVSSLRMSHVPGATLAAEWPRLDGAGRAAVARELGGSVRDMRAKVRPPRGRGGWVCAADGGAFNFPLDMGYDRPVGVGPFRSQADFNRWLMSEVRPPPFGDPSSFSKTAALLGARLDELAKGNPVVFTHGDLHLHNIIVKAGKHNVIDWGNAGFFPEWVEYVRFVDACQKDADLLGGEKGIKVLAKQVFERSYEKELALWREMSRYMQ